MRFTARHLSLLVATILLLMCLAACSSRRNKDFAPALPPTDTASATKLPADFQCWIYTTDGENIGLTGFAAVELFESVTDAYERSSTAESFPDKDGKFLLIFCTGGTAPDMVIPAYQLPNAVLYGVYTLFSDDTGRYGNDMVTAHVHSFSLEEGTYEALLNLVKKHAK